MNEYPAEWIDALRSGKYHKCTGGLKEVHEHGVYYCCLGVLSDICKIGHWEYAVFYSDKHSSGSCLTLDVRKKYGIDDPWGIIRGLKDIGGETVYLAGLNDTGFTFDQIADMIDYFWRDI